jgi:hypothetical protein
MIRRQALDINLESLLSWFQQPGNTVMLQLQVHLFCHRYHPVDNQHLFPFVFTCQQYFCALVLPFLSSC